MSTPIEELTALVDALRAETFEQSITPERIGAILQRMIDVLPSVSDANSLKGWVAISSINELPTSPSPSQQALAYLLDTTLYVYVGSGGDTLEGKYRSAELKGTKGDIGKDGVDLGSEYNLVDDLFSGGHTDVLTGEMGKILRSAIDLIFTSLGDYAFPNGKPSLPWAVPDYVEIEYLQSDGNQYIDTGVVGKLNTRIEIKASASAVPAWFCGSRGDNTNDITVYATSNATCRFGNKSANHNFSANTLYEVSFAKDSLVVNGASKAIGASTAFTTPTNIYIMWCGTSFNNGGLRVYSFKLYDGNDLLRDMIPVRVGQVGYMYDRVSGQLFGNAGSGSFVLGNDKN